MKGRHMHYMTQFAALNFEGPTVEELRKTRADREGEKAPRD